MRLAAEHYRCTLRTVKLKAARDDYLDMYS